MKVLYVLSHGRQTAQNISEDMRAIFASAVDVKPICVEDGLSDIDFSDAIVLDTGKWTEDLHAEAWTAVQKEPVKLIKARRVIDFAKLPEIMNLPEGTNVLLVNDHEKTADIAIKQLLELGLGHLNFYPYYPTIKDYRKLSIAITPGEPHLMPECVQQCIDIGTRKIDITTIVEVAEALDVLEQIGATLSSTYIRDMFQLVKQYDRAAKDSAKMRDTFQVLADYLDSGIIYMDENQKVVIANKALYKMFGKLVQDVIDWPANMLIPNLEEALKAPYEKHLVHIDGQGYVLSLSDVSRPDQTKGMILRIDDANAIQKLEHELRRKSRPSPHNAQYTFSDIHYESDEMHKTVELAKQFATSEATVLLQGESGTGKELLAQAMHNHSSRRDGPFVPINFAAMSESLLESELFGYEAGAFTGAKKGGAQGIFEAAHGGTLFLDEIGDAPLSFQARLLRVLQEKQIRRIGGAHQIPVDVRVIAATNMDLELAVQQKRFREDLFYRLCVLPIYVPRLRDRSQDIHMLLRHSMGLYKARPVELEDYLTPDALEYLKKYPWPGNIRQLANLAEYLINVVHDGVPLRIEALPMHIGQKRNEVSSELVLKLAGEELLWLLEAIDNMPSSGRRTLEKRAKEEGLAMTEAQIRRLIKTAEEKGLVTVGKGRAGVKLTKLGYEVLLIEDEIK